MSGTRMSGSLKTIAATLLVVLAVTKFAGTSERVVDDKSKRNPSHEKGKHSGKEPVEQITVENLLALRPFEALEADVDEMRSEIEQLKKKAALLDARRKAELMIAAN